MNKQFVWALVATLGLAGCGGGGGSDGGGDSDGPGADDGQVRASDLVGTWQETNSHYSQSSTPGERTWYRTRRKTIVVEEISTGLRFTNCVTGEHLDGSLSNNVVTFPVQDNLEEVLELDVTNPTTLVTSLVDDFTNTEIEAELRKISSDTTIERADADLTVNVETLPSFTRSSWTQLCVETQVQAGQYFAEFKGRTTVLANPVTVSIRFDSVNQFATGNSIYPGASMDVSGSFDAPTAGVTGELYNPLSGSVALSVGSEAVDFTISDLVMQSDQGLEVEIDGTINLNSSWLALPEAD